MSEFAELMADAQAEIHDAFGGVAGTYSPRDGSDVAVADASFRGDPDAEIRHDRGEETKRVAVLVLLTTEVAKPVRYATWTPTDTGETWTIDQVHPLSGAHRCRCSRFDSEERSDASYRGNMP